MFNPLMMSYTRVPFAMAEDSVHASRLAHRHPNLLARAFTLQNRAGVPWLSVVFCGFIWALALGFTFERLISIDLVLYGAALVLEFIALVVLRLREPSLPRPFSIPGGLTGVIAAGIGPTLLIAFALYAARNERVLGLPALIFAALVAFTGAALYALTHLFQPSPTP
jgi:amino acid transporter